MIAMILATLISVNAGGNFQAALNSAVPGDVIELQAGATFTGTFNLPVKTPVTGAYVTIRSSAYSSIPSGRLDPVLSGSYLAKLRVAVANKNIITNTDGAAFYKFVGIDFGPTSGISVTALVQLGKLETNPANLPDHIEFDQCYFHGDPVLGSRRAGVFDAKNLRIERSYFKDFKALGSDSNGIWIYNTTGPGVIHDNYVEGAGENIFFGGADSQAESLIPTGYTITNNTVTKPLSWCPFHASFGGSDGDALTTLGPNVLSSNGATVTSTAHGILDVNYIKLTSGSQAGEIRQVVGVVDANTVTIASPFSANQTSVTWKKLEVWTVKNLFEMKIGVDFTVSGNVFENSWHSSDQHRGINLKSENQNGHAPWTVTANVLFENNIVKNVKSGLGIVGKASNRVVVRAHDITVRNNIFIGLDAPFSGPGDPDGVLVANGASNVTLDHNVFETQIGADQTGKAIVLESSNPKLSNLVIQNNIFRRGFYGMKGTGTAEGTATLNGHASSYSFVKNVMADDGASVVNYPAQNYAEADFESLFLNYPVDWSLANSSPYIALGTDSKDIGVDWTELQAALVP